jgi:hypothetical protein
MSDERDLTPEQEARVARLLADARVEEPMPAEVAERLDRVLAGLAGEPVSPPPERPAPVVDLAARRRRRVRTLLVAAAAVVVAGVGVGRLVGTQDDMDGAGGQGAAETSTRLEDAPESAREGGPSQEFGDSDGAMSPDELKSLGEPARITTSSFASAVRKLQSRPGVRSNAASGLMDGSDLAAPDMGFRCAPTAFGAGKLIAVRYNGSPAVLVYRPPAGGTQVVDLMQCRSGDILRSTTIPLP